MSSSRALSCLLSRRSKTRLPFFVQCIKKQLLDSVVVMSRIFKVSIMVISRRLRLITPTSTLIVLNITKTSSNNCFETIQKQKKERPSFWEQPRSARLLTVYNWIDSQQKSGICDRTLLDFSNFKQKGL